MVQGANGSKREVLERSIVEKEALQELFCYCKYRVYTTAVEWTLYEPICLWTH